jgi:hypothetical protein
MQEASGFEFAHLYLVRSLCLFLPIKYLSDLLIRRFKKVYPCIVFHIKHMKHEMYLNSFSKFSLYLTGNRFHFLFRECLVNAS